MMTVGDNVRIMLDPNEQMQSNRGVWEHQGEEHKITRRRVIAYGLGKTTRGVYYELEGVQSEMGVPYGFLEEQLVPLM